MIRDLNRKKLYGTCPTMTMARRTAWSFPFFDVSDVTTTVRNYMLVRGARLEVVPLVPGHNILAGRSNELVILPAISDELAIRDKEFVTMWMNQSSEEAIRLAPEQHRWLYRCFKTRPSDRPSFYSWKWAWTDYLRSAAGIIRRIEESVSWRLHSLWIRLSLTAEFIAVIKICEWMSLHCL